MGMVMHAGQSRCKIFFFFAAKSVTTLACLSVHSYNKTKERTKSDDNLNILSCVFSIYLAVMWLVLVCRNSNQQLYVKVLKIW
jgi:hypothetical protein